MLSKASKTMGADPDTVSRLKQMQEDDEDEEEAGTKDKGSTRKDEGKTRNDTVKYSDEEDDEHGMSREDLQVCRACARERGCCLLVLLQ
jgi:hypothetical protein